MKLQQQPNGQYMISVPKDVVKGFDWKKGDVLEFKITGAGKMELFRRK